MKKVVLFSSIFMMAAAMNAWAVECAEGTYGALSVATVDGKCVATLDPESAEDVNIPDDVTIDEFVYNRNFKAEDIYTGPSRGKGVMTLCLPFSGVIKSGGTLYEIIGITKKNWGNDVWVIETEVSDSKEAFEAGKPYFVISNGDGPATFAKDYEGGSQISMNTSSLSPVTFGENNEWEFRGTYTYKKWEEGDSQIGHVYGFAAKDTTTASGSFKAGQFVKVKAGAFIKPMRAYLYYNKKAASQNRPPVKGALAKSTALDDEDLPSSIEVIFKDKNGAIASIGRMDPVTGTVTPVEGWYDMKGRKLNKKPTLPGTYFNNGEKVIIK